MARVLLVGGTGFIGMRAARQLASQGYTPRILDLPSALARTALPDNWEVVAGDATDAASMLAAAQGCEGIIHLAGMMTLDCARNPDLAIRLNVIGSLNALEAARQTGARVALLSSAGVFGPDHSAYPEPLTLYGVTKLAVEGMARVWAADHGVPSLSLRPYVVYGPGVSSGIASGPSLALRASALREPATIRFSGRVGLVYVDDVARMLAAGATRPITGAHILTMPGETADIQDFMRELANQSGWDGINAEGAPLRIPSDLAQEALPDVLGAQPVTTIAQGIAATLAELRALHP